jgi:hypothetical protein
MKRILFFVSALAGLFFAASCQQENLDPMSGGSNVVTYTVEVPGALSTKAIGTDVSAVTELIYEVYLVDSDTKEEKKLYRNTETISNGTATVELELVNNQDFRVLFWAQVPGNGVYQIPEDKGLKEVKLSTSLRANSENYAAFADSDFIEYGEPLLGRTITLSRPVAQLNIATTPESLKLGEKADGTEAQTTITFKNTCVTVEGLSTTYNVATGEAGSDSDVFTYEANLPYDSDANTLDQLSEKTLKVGTEDYTYVSMNYVGFAQPTGDNVKVTYTIETNEVGTIKNTISNVPVKANYRTNIIGNLITSMSDYKVTLESDWTDLPGGNMEVIADGLVKNINGDYEVTNAAGLAYAINNLFANGGNFYLTKELYEMAGYDVNPPESVTGSLNVYGELPVVTRSTAGVVTITGLDLTALVPVVSAGGSASFSNIKLDSATDFVGTNNGTVGFDNCFKGGVSKPEELITNNDNGSVVDLSAEIQTLAQLQAAINTGAKIELTTPLINPKGETFTLDLKGTTVSIVDETTKNFELIKNQGTLVIKNTGSKTAAMTVESTIDSEWDRYSAVIANTVGGNLTVEGNIVLEHLGGTAMAYGIDNLTNGKGTCAVVTINGATVKSPYRAVRQFLNGVEATNELTIKAGSVIDGANKSIFFHDPSKNANTGKLVVESGAQLKGDVYLFVTEGSTQWPVSVSISSSALAEGSQVLTGNLPEGYSVEEKNGVYEVTYKSPAQARLEALINKGGEVVLTEDIELSSPIEIKNVTVTLDLNGKTITAGKDGYAIKNYGKLTIKDKDSGEINGVVYAEGTSANTTIQGGTFNALENAKYVFLNSQGGSLTIDNATINGGSSYPIYSYDENSNLVINNVTVNATFGCVNAYGNNGTVVINDGIFQMTGVQGTTSHIAYFSSNAQVTINGGTFQKIGDINMSAVGGGGICANGGADITINGGNFAGDHADYYNWGKEGTTITVKGGTFKFEPKEFIAENYKAVENNGVWSVVVDPAAKIGTTEYASLSEAFEVGGNITLLRDVKVTETLVLAEGNTATLDLNGYNITVPEAAKHIYAINNKGNLTLKDSKGTGSVKARGIYNGNDGAASAKMTVMGGNYFGIDTDGGAAIMNYAELVINGGEFYGGNCAVNNKAATAQTTIHAGKFGGAYMDNLSTNYVIQNNEGTLIVNNAEVVSGFGAIGAYGGTTTIEDGSFLPIGWAGYTSHVVYVAAAAHVTINGGTYKMNYAENAVPDSGSAVASYYKGTLSITGGTFYAHFDHVSPVELSEGSSITGGTYYNHAGAVSQHSFIKNYVAEGYELNANGEVVEI